MGWWSDIKPEHLSKKQAGHPWIFAAYHETPSERDDGRWYTAFLFRNKERTVFGIKEYFDLPYHKNVRALATKVVLDSEFRKTLLSNDPDLANMWKRH